MNLAVIGAGKWGKNLLREFNKISKISYICHKGDKKTDQWLKENYPTADVLHDYQIILKDKGVEAAVIATPIKTHFQIAYDCLNAGKHVFLEKPMTDNESQAKKLVDLARKKKLILFIGHIFLHHPVFEKIKSLIKKDPVQFADFYWNKWGHFNEDIVWNLVCHDAAIALNLLGQPKKISIINKTGFVTNGDSVSLTLEFYEKKKAVININRLSPIKQKTVTLFTKKNLLVWTDNSLYKLVKKTGNLKLIYKSAATPLAKECRTFLQSIKTKKPAITDGEFGLKVIKILARL